MASTRSSQSAGGIESVSSLAISSQRASSKPWAVQAAIPGSSTAIRRAPAAAQTAAVLSVLALSTTTISSAGRVWPARAERQAASMSASFRVGITTEIVAMVPRL